MRWQRGDEILWREVWRGRPYMTWPVRVVEDSPARLVIYVAEGTSFRFESDGWPWADEHPWLRRGRWEGHGILVQHRPGDAHAVWHFWEGPERRFAGWYVNLQAPLRRADRGFETQDHELDLWIDADGSWRWKDEAKLDDWVRRGRFTGPEAAAIRAEGKRVLAAWPFPTGWEEWRPDPTWPVPELSGERDAG